MSQTIKVFVRPRPLKPNETLNCDLQVSAEKKGVHLKDKFFSYDGVFTERSSQKEVYKAVVAPLIEQVLNGFNCTVFAYGQTGSGKTFTMEGEQCNDSNLLSQSAGLIPRSFSQIFRNLTDKDRVIKVSFVELYNEEVYDLLSPLIDDIAKLRIQENKRGSLVINNLVELVVKSEDELFDVLKQGSRRRQVAATLLNAASSRSHAIFTMTVHVTEASTNNDEVVKIGKLNLVDLAGSENISRSGAIDKRVREASCINKSLLTFGRVIYCLENGITHVPYRESKLTRLLQDSLGGNAKTIMIANISPAIEDMEDTSSTLDYAFRARRIVNKPEVNKKIKKKEFIREWAEKYDELARDYRTCYLKQGMYMDGNKYDEMIRQLRDHDKIVKDKDDKLREEKEEKEILLRKIENLENILREKEKELENQLQEKICQLEDKENELKVKTHQVREKDEQLKETFQQLRKCLQVVEDFIR